MSASVVDNKCGLFFFFFLMVVTDNFLCVVSKTPQR